MRSRSAPPSSEEFRDRISCCSGGPPLARSGRVFLPESPSDPTPAKVQREACRRLEALGYRSAWTNELIGKDSFAQLSVLPAATEHMVFGTCIANIWARPAQTAHAAATVLSEAHPGRLILGALGSGIPSRRTAAARSSADPAAPRAMAARRQP